MDWDQAAAFAVFVLVAAGTPGPSNVLLLATGANAGVVRGFPCLLGVTLGMGAMMFAVAFGLGSIIVGNDTLISVLRYAGAAFLLWLAWKIASADTAPSEEDAAPVGFFGAAAFQWVNPKSWLVTVSATAAYISADAGSALDQATILGGLFTLAASPPCFVWLAFGAGVRRFLSEPRARRIFNVVMGALLAASVAMIFL
jgi:threonine/homoserine/homoserine lactone efflux protein